MATASQKRESAMTAAKVASSGRSITRGSRLGEGRRLSSRYGDATRSLSDVIGVMQAPGRLSLAIALAGLFLGLVDRVLELVAVQLRLLAWMRHVGFGVCHHLVVAFGLVLGHGNLLFRLGNGRRAGQFPGSESAVFNGWRWASAQGTLSEP